MQEIKFTADGVTIEVVREERGDVRIRILDPNAIDEGIYLSPDNAIILGMAITQTAQKEQDT